MNAPENTQPKSTLKTLKLTVNTRYIKIIIKQARYNTRSSEGRGKKPYIRVTTRTVSTNIYL
jgi:hypothetical protein